MREGDAGDRAVVNDERVKLLQCWGGERCVTERSAGDVQMTKRSKMPEDGIGEAVGAPATVCDSCNAPRHAERVQAGEMGEGGIAEAGLILVKAAVVIVTLLTPIVEQQRVQSGKMSEGGIAHGKATAAVQIECVQTSKRGERAARHAYAHRVQANIAQMRHAQKCCIQQRNGRALLDHDGDDLRSVAEQMAPVAGESERAQVSEVNEEVGQVAVDGRKDVVSRSAMKTESVQKRNVRKHITGELSERLPARVERMQKRDIAKQSAAHEGEAALDVESGEVGKMTKRISFHTCVDPNPVQHECVQRAEVGKLAKPVIAA